MTQKDLFPTAISSPQDTPVNPLALRGSKEARKMTVTSGRTSLELLHPRDPLGYVSKMFMVMLEWDSTRCSTTGEPQNLQKVMAHTDIKPSRGRGFSGQTYDQEQSQPELGGVADGLPSRLDGFDGWEVEPEDIPRVVTGMTGRANRLKGLGNAIVPRIAMNIGLAIKEMVDA